MTITYQQLSNGDLFSSPSLLHCARRCLKYSTVNNTCNAFAFDNLTYGWVGLQKTYFHLNNLAIFIILKSVGAKITTYISLPGVLWWAYPACGRETQAMSVGRNWPWRPPPWWSSMDFQESILVDQFVPRRAVKRDPLNKVGLLDQQVAHPVWRFPQEKNTLT